MRSTGSVNDDRRLAGQVLAQADRLRRHRPRGRARGSRRRGRAAPVDEVAESPAPSSRGGRSAAWRRGRDRRRCRSRCRDWRASAPGSVSSASEAQSPGSAARRLRRLGGRLARRSAAGALVGALEQRIALQFVLDEGGELDVRHLQQLDRLQAVAASGPSTGPAASPVCAESAIRTANSLRTATRRPRAFAARFLLIPRDARRHSKARAPPGRRESAHVALPRHVHRAIAADGRPSPRRPAATI